MSKKRQPGKRGKDLPPFNKWLEKAIEDSGLSQAELARRAAIAPSTISMLLSGVRPSPTHRVAVRLASELRPRDKSVPDFLRELCEHARISDFREPPGESVVSRFERGNTDLRVAVVRYEPFVIDANRGFAIDLMSTLASVLGARIAAVSPINLSELETAFDAHDIVVSGLFPTFRRRQFMSFSRPLPFLRVHLTAVARRARALSAGDILKWANEPPDKARIMLVNGEVGDEFVSSYLPAVREEHIEDTDELDIQHIRDTLLDGRADIFIGDRATCVAVERLSPKELEIVRDERDEESDIAVLADYPVAFGLPKQDKEWRRLVDAALEATLSEGLRVLAALYMKYLQISPSFFWLIRDDLAEATRVHAAGEPFAKVFALAKEKRALAEKKRKDQRPDA